MEAHTRESTTKRGRQGSSSGIRNQIDPEHCVHNTKSGIKCMYFNADNLLNKRNELKLVIAEHNPSMIGISEVVPKNCETTTNLAELQLHYTCFDNLKGAKRGVCIYVHETL